MATIDKFPSQPFRAPAPQSGTQTDPHNAEAERALLGAILLEPDILASVGKLVQPADLFNGRHTLIYHCMSVVAQKGQRVDMVTLCAELEARNRLDFIGGSGYLTQLLDETPTARGFESYAALIRESALRRRLMHKALDIARIALHEQDVDVRQLVADLQREMDAAQPAAKRDAWTLFTLDEDSEADPPLEFVVDPILPTQSLTMVYGAPGTLKSMLLADMAVCVAGGKGKGSGDAAVKEAVVEALANAPLNKAQLEAKVRAALPDARQKHIRRIVDEMTGDTIKIRAGERHTKLLELV